jgi:succinoglycan biosynthesis transport protein ExoP
MDPRPLTIRDYVSILWRRKWIVVAMLALVAATAAFFSYRATPQYTSTSEVVVRPARFDPTQPSEAFGFQNMVTEVQLANSSEVAQAATDGLVGRGINPASVSAAQVTDAETIVFTATSPDPKSASASANAWANAYLANRLDKVLEQLQKVRDPLDARIHSLSTALARINRTLKTTTDPTLVTVLNTRYITLSNARTDVMQQLASIVRPENVSVGDVIRPAKYPTSPSSPNHIRDIGLALFVGLALGVAFAILRDRLDPRVRSREDLEVHSGAPVLAFVPRMHLKKPTVVVLSEAGSEAAEAYKGLRVRVLHAASERQLKTILVTSSLASEGKTCTTANLAASLALAGKRVIVVAADLRRPGIQDYFQLDDGLGLADALADSVSTSEILNTTSDKMLGVVAPGNRASVPVALERLGSERMGRLLAELRGLADFVIIDTPPLLTTSDVAALAPLSDAVLFVVDPRRVEAALVEQARRELALLGSSILGIVVNRFNPRKFRAYGQGYGYSAYESYDQAAQPSGRDVPVALSSGDDAPPSR